MVVGCIGVGAGGAGGGNDDTETLGFDNIAGALACPAGPLPLPLSPSPLPLLPWIPPSQHEPKHKHKQNTLYDTIRLL